MVVANKKMNNIFKGKQSLFTVYTVKIIVHIEGRIQGGNAPCPLNTRIFLVLFYVNEEMKLIYLAPH